MPRSPSRRACSSDLTPRGPAWASRTREDARRVAVTAQLLTAARPADIIETVDGLAAVNIDPTAAVAPSADLILWSRLGWPYQPADLTRLMQVDRAVFEWRGHYRPMADLPMYLPAMREGVRYEAPKAWLAANGGFRRDVLARLRADGPLHAAEIDDTAAVPWRSTGWSAGRNVTQLLELLTATGETVVWGRDAKGRMWDVADRVYPAGVADLDPAEAARQRAETRLRALGIAPRTATQQPGEGFDVGDVGVAVDIDGVPGDWRADPDVLAVLDGYAPRAAALLSPFDRLVADRVRLERVFGFEYLLEMYKPKDTRRWGYFALPILVGDRLVGKLDAAADRRAGVLRVLAIHEDAPFDDVTALAVEAEIDDLARWLGLEVVAPPR